VKLIQEHSEPHGVMIRARIARSAMRWRQPGSEFRHHLRAVATRRSP
jgi:hypothetical protein